MKTTEWSTNDDCFCWFWAAYITEYVTLQFDENYDIFFRTKRSDSDEVLND